MNFADWFPAITTTGLLAAVTWLSRNLTPYSTYKTVEHEFDIKLEKMCSQLRGNEDRIKADLRTKEAEIAALRGGAITALASRQIASDKRRYEAVDQLWSSVIALSRARYICNIMSTIKFEVAAQRTERNPRLQEVFKSFDAGFDLKKLDLSGRRKSSTISVPHDLGNVLSVRRRHCARRNAVAGIEVWGWTARLRRR